MYTTTSSIVVKPYTGGVPREVRAITNGRSLAQIAREELAAIVDGVRQRNGFTLVDEIYLDLSYGQPGEIARPRSALELGDDLIVANSFFTTSVEGSLTTTYPSPS